MFNRYLAVHQS